VSILEYDETSYPLTFVRYKVSVNLTIEVLAAAFAIIFVMVLPVWLGMRMAQWRWERCLKEWSVIYGYQISEKRLCNWPWNRGPFIFRPDPVFFVTAIDRDWNTRRGWVAIGSVGAPWWSIAMSPKTHWIEIQSPNNQPA
jgi:hypothetical protein